MDRNIAYCGIRCDSCPALKATREDDDELRARTAAEWSKQFNAEIPACAINCVGCTAAGVHIRHWDECGIRQCAQERGHANCGACPDYACEQLAGFFRMVPDARTELDSLRGDA
jgi:hypothetical protein